VEEIYQVVRVLLVAEDLLLMLLKDIVVGAAVLRMAEEHLYLQGAAQH
jgi:hypothetical protein